MYMMENEELMQAVLNGEPFTTWNDYNRRYNDYMSQQNILKSQKEKRKDCLHSHTIILSDGRLKCTNCGKTN